MRLERKSKREKGRVGCERDRRSMEVRGRRRDATGWRCETEGNGERGK